jgi:hypothetical protein
VSASASTATRRRSAKSASQSRRELPRRAPELLEEPQVVLEEEAKVGNAVLSGTRAIDAGPEAKPE